MYAIVEIAGQQFKVEKDRKIFVHRLEGEEGSTVEFDKVLLIDNDGKVKVGKPTVKAAKISAKILVHQKGDKVLVFKKKRRKGYKTLNGHRQQFTQIQIEEIIA
ncbi:MAG: 50S ribosomal protein L21 [Bacteroidales bacterium]|nr:50S ribosomal protein L21 [Bacteroidales bacterium]MCK5029595.1 50S ribosomal protein L21 [Bacteroidales bacterium]